MRRYLALALLGGSVGCQNPFRQPAPVCAPEACAPAAAPAPAACAPKIEVQTPETIVIRPPTPKVVYEQPAQQQPAGPGFGGAPGGQPQMMMPQPQMMMPQAGFGATPMGGLMGGEIKERTQVGVMFDTIRIPLPWLRLKAIQQPSEVTFRSQIAPPSPFGGTPVMMNGSFGAVGMAPMATGFGAAPMMPAGGFGGVGGGQMVYTGTQYVPVTGTMPVQVPNGGVAASGAAAGGGGVTFGAAGGAAPDAAEVAKLKQKLQECEELLKKQQAEKKP